MNRNPNRITLSRRKTLAALGSIGAASAVAGLGTSAFFSDQEALTNNSLVAGELDLKVAATSHYVDWLPAGNGPGETNDAGMPGGSEDSDLVLEAGPNQSDAWPIELEIDDATGFAEGSVAETANGSADVDGSLCSGDNDADEAVLVDLDDVKPGDFGLLRFAFESCTNPAFLWFRGSLDSARENDVTEPEAEDPDERDGVVELLDAVRVAAIPGDAVDRLESNADDSGDDPTLEVAGEMSLREFLAGRPTMPLDGDIPHRKEWRGGCAELFRRRNRPQLHVHLVAAGRPRQPGSDRLGDVQYRLLRGAVSPQRRTARKTAIAPRPV